jgi:hypothetical protein
MQNVDVPSDTILVFYQRAQKLFCVIYIRVPTQKSGWDLASVAFVKKPYPHLSEVIW